MASRSLSRIERRAIWQAGGCACAYCGDPIRFRDTEIDHIVPRSLDAQSLAEQKVQQGLPADFDINGYENLAPTCAACNRRKSTHVVQAGRLAIELAIASRLKSRVIALVAQFTRQSEIDKVRLMLAEALSTGRLTPADLRAIVGGDPIRRELLDEHPSLFSSIDLDAIDDQVAEKIRNTPTAPAGGIELRGEREDQRAIVSTIAEYETALAAGMFAYSRFASSMAFRYFEIPRQILSYLRLASYADDSFIRFPRRSVCDIALLPASLLICGIYESDETYQRDLSEVAGHSVADLVRDQHARIVSVDAYSLIITFGNCQIAMTELLRADVDGDGIEDLVVSFGMSLIDGSFSQAEVLCLRRLSSEALFEVS